MSPASPLPLEPRPSRWLRAGILSVHILAAGSLCLADLPHWAAGSGLAALAISAFLSLRNPPDHTLRLGPDGSLQVRVAGGEWLTARVLPDSHVSPWLVVLRYTLEETGRTARRVLPLGSLPADDFRRLRTWLLWRAGAIVDTSGKSTHR